MFGWFRSKRKWKGSGSLVVLPLPAELTGWNALSSTVDERPDYSYLASPWIGAADYREYIPGDPLRSIHWKNSARSGKLQVRLPEAGRNDERCIVLNTFAAGYPGEDGFEQEDYFEQAVSVAAGLCYRARAASSEQTVLHMLGCASSSGIPERRTAGEEMDELLALAAVRLQDKVMEKSIQAGLSGLGPSLLGRELHLVTGIMNEELADAAIQLMSNGAVITVYKVCFHSGQTGSLEEGENRTGQHSGNASFYHMLPESESRFIQAGGRLFIVMDGGIHQIGSQERGSGGRYG
nr:DUF58 domain-containing protein [Paenibacillus lemnae]